MAGYPDVEIERIVRTVKEVFADLPDPPFVDVVQDEETGRLAIDIMGMAVVRRLANGKLAVVPLTMDGIESEDDPETADKVHEMWMAMKPTFDPMWDEMTATDWAALVATLAACSLSDAEFRQMAPRLHALAPKHSVLNRPMPD